MKISTDLTLGRITDEDTGEIFRFKNGHYDAGYRFEQVIQKILSPTQYKRVLEHDGVFKLSKKGEKTLKEEIDKLKV